MKPKITELNHLDKMKCGVWSKGNKETFAYSDGEEEEKRLKTVVTDAKDLSTQSEELEKMISNWSLEYHLSHQRAHILKALDLKDVKRVLELGCGCGAISRYLGEQGHQVDAIEGSQTRAEIAQMRCRDLDHVNIFHGNFNELKIPENEYDLVLLIGAIEYAGRFFPEISDDKDAAVKVLTLAKKAANANGIIVTAIENRMGLKYWLGSSEDHHGEPYIGLYGYPHALGIKTYDRREWLSILDRSNFRFNSFLYPFPDYKLARAVLTDNFVRNEKYAYSLLYRIGSRDYENSWIPECDEFLLWRSIHRSGYLEDFSNSFMIVCCLDEKQLQQVCSHDFVYFSDPLRKPEYRTITRKISNEDIIRKERVSIQHIRQPSKYFEQVTDQKKYLRGPLLSTIWLQALVGNLRDGQDFTDLLKYYYKFILDSVESPQSSKECIDLIPSNIIVDDNGNYHIIDQEWRLKDTVEAEFLLFRGLLWFGFSNKYTLQPFFERNNLHNLKEFIEYCYHLLSLSIDYITKVEHFIGYEEQLQAETAIQHRSELVKKSMNRPFAEESLDSWPKTFAPKLYWADSSSAFTESNSTTQTATIQADLQLIVFRLPNSESKIEKLRFDPDTQPGFFHIYTTRLFYLEERTGKRELIWELKGNEAIARNSQMVGIQYCKAALGEALCATNHDPQLIFKLPDLTDYTHSESIFQLEVEMDYTKTADFLIAKDTFINAHQALTENLKDKDKIISVLKTKLTSSEKLVKEKNHRLNIAESELELIKNSKVWRTAEILRKLFYNNLLIKLPQLKRFEFGFRQYGFRKSAAKVIKLLRIILSRNRPITGAGFYQQWIAKNHLNKADLNKLALDLQEFSYMPLISIIMPVFNVDERWLKKAIDSVISQVYGNWELCIVDDGSDNRNIRVTIDNYKLKDNRIKTKYLQENQGITGASNEALAMANGQFIGFLDHDDELSRDALFEVVKLLNDNNDLDLIYSDEDKISSDGLRSEPFFKPDWSPDTFRSYNYLCHFTVIRKEIIDSVGGFRQDFEGSQDYDLFLRVIDETQKIEHIAKILYHWRAIDTSVAKDPNSKRYAIKNGKKALLEHLQRNNLKGQVADGELLGNYRVQYQLVDNPKVTILIPTKDKIDVLKRCIVSITTKTNYPNYEIVIVDNGSTAKETMTYYDTIRDDDRLQILEYDHPFNFSAINNYGVGNTDSEYIVFLNNDTEIISECWIEAMLEFAQREDVGAVGALLYYPNDTVQHAGVIIGLGGVAGHSHKHIPKESMGYYSRIKISQNLSAVTAACLMTKKSIFEAVGGFDENLSHAFNDIDLCLKIRQKGYLIVYTPYSELYHHESLSRGYENTPSKLKRFTDEIIYFKKRWHRELKKGDPYYNPNLTLDREDFSINI